MFVNSKQYPQTTYYSAHIDDDDDPGLKKKETENQQEQGDIRIDPTYDSNLLNPLW